MSDHETDSGPVDQHSGHHNDDDINSADSNSQPQNVVVSTTQSYAPNTVPYSQNTGAYPPNTMPYPSNTPLHYTAPVQGYPYDPSQPIPQYLPPQGYPPRPYSPYSTPPVAPIVHTPPPAQIYYVNTTPTVSPSQEVSTTVVEEFVPPEPTKTNSYIVNVLIVAAFLAGLTVLLSSFQWNPSENKTTETDPVTGESSTEVTENTGATAFANAVIFIVWIAIAIMNLYVFCSNRSCHCHLGMYYMSCCILPSIIIIFFVYLLVDNPKMDTVWGVRIAFLIVMSIWSCVIACCVYVNRVTERWVTTTTTRWSDGRKTKDTKTDDFGYVKCRNWGI